MNEPDCTPNPSSPRVNLSRVLKRRQRKGTGWLSPAEVRALHDGRAWLQADLLRAEPLARQALNVLTPHWSVEQPPAQAEMSTLETLGRVRGLLDPGSALITNIRQFKWITPQIKRLRVPLRSLPWALLILHLERRLQLLARLERGDQLRELNTEIAFSHEIREFYISRSSGWGSHDWTRHLGVTVPSKELISLLFGAPLLTVDRLLNEPGFRAQRTLVQSADLLINDTSFFENRRTVSHAGTLTDQTPPGGRWSVRTWRAGPFAGSSYPEPKSPGRQTRPWLITALRSSGLSGEEFARSFPDSGHTNADLWAFIMAGGLSTLRVPASDHQRYDAANWGAYLIVLLALPERFRTQLLSTGQRNDLSGMLSLARLAADTGELPHLGAALRQIIPELERAVELEARRLPELIGRLSA